MMRLYLRGYYEIDQNLGHGWLLTSHLGPLEVFQGLASCLRYCINLVVLISPDTPTGTSLSTVSETSINEVVYLPSALSTRAFSSPNDTSSCEETPSRFDTSTVT